MWTLHKSSTTLYSLQYSSRTSAVRGLGFVHTTISICLWCGRIHISRFELYNMYFMGLHTRFEVLALRHILHGVTSIVQAPGSLFISCYQSWVTNSNTVGCVGLIGTYLATWCLGIPFGLIGDWWAYRVRLSSILHSNICLSYMILVSAAQFYLV